MSNAGYGPLLAELAAQGGISAEGVGAERPCILVDKHEKCPLQFSGAVDVELCTFETGDYSARHATHIVALERKRLSELATCCGSDRERFMAQMERLQAYPVRGLIVEGNLSSIVAGWYRSKIKPTSVLGTLVALHVDMNIPIWFCEDARIAADIVERILVRVHHQHVARAA